LSGSEEGMLYLIVFLVVTAVVFSLNFLLVTRRQKETNWPLLASWIIAIWAIAAVVISSNYYEGQINEMEKSRRFEWRPFLEISHLAKKNKKFFVKLRTKRDAETATRFDIWQYTRPERLNVLGYDNLINKISEEKQEIRDIEEVSTADSLFSYADTLLIPSARKILYENLGRTPLRIKTSYISILTQNEWDSTYHKSAMRLVRDIPSKVEYSREWETDYIVKAGEKKESVQYPHLKIMPVTELFDYYYADSSMAIYWVSYFEYEDFFGYDYNTLLVEYELFRIDLIGNYFQIRSEKAGVEKYRWDVGIH
jgi:hypothetical protein